MRIALVPLARRPHSYVSSCSLAALLAEHAHPDGRHNLCEVDGSHPRNGGIAAVKRKRGLGCSHGETFQAESRRVWGGGGPGASPEGNPPRGPPPVPRA